MLTLQFFALQHTCNNRSLSNLLMHVLWYNCYILLDIIWLLLIMWHAFASSYKHKWRYLQTRRTILSSYTWLLFVRAAAAVCWGVKLWLVNSISWYTHDLSTLEHPHLQFFKTRLGGKTLLLYHFSNSLTLFAMLETACFAAEKRCKDVNNTKMHADLIVTQSNCF